MLHARHDGAGESVSAFVLHLQSALQYERFDAVASFAGRDRSGGFGILAGHERMIACLDFGLAAFGTADGRRHYLALPGGVLYFRDNQLYLSARRYLRDEDYRRVSAALQEELRVEQESLRGVRQSLQRMEREMFRRLWEMGRGGERLL